MKSIFYVLDENKNPRPSSASECGDMWREKKQVCKYTAGTFHNVSTIFLGIDHNFVGDGAPILFETALITNQLFNFKKMKVRVIKRHHTYDEAVAYHDWLCDYVFFLRYLKKILCAIIKK